MFKVIACIMMALCFIEILYAKVKTDLDIIDILNKENDK